MVMTRSLVTFFCLSLFKFDINIYAANIIIQVNVKVCYRNLQMLVNVNFSLKLIRCILKNGLFVNIT